jgi:hypothetical protein
MPSGFIVQQTMQAIGFEEKSSSGRFEAFCEKIDASALISNGNQLRPFIECDNPFGPRATWLPWELLHKVIVCGARAYRKGDLTAHQAHIGERCQDLADDLVGVGIASLIDEATGYQYSREIRRVRVVVAAGEHGDPR